MTVIVRATNPITGSVRYSEANDWQVGEDGYLTIYKSEITESANGLVTSVESDPVGLHAPGTWEYVRTADDS